MSDASRRGYQLENFVGLLFGKAHFEVTKNPGAGGRRQVDLLATMGDETYLVEAKWWKAKPGVGEVQALEDRLKQTPPSVLGLFVSSSGFTQGAIDRVESKPKRPILLVTGEELEQVIGWDGDFLRMLRRKRDAMLVDGEVAWVTGQLRGVPRRRRGTLPPSPETIVLRDGTRSKFLHCGGDFGEFAFLRELPDIDWVPGSGFGVTLDMATPATDEKDLVSLLHELSDLGWITDKSRWSIQQSEDTWHGAGADVFANVLRDWKTRYEGRRIHHTEEFCYVDLCDDIGFYTLTGQVAAHSPRTVWRASLSFQLSGIPIDPKPLQHLAQRFEPGTTVFFRPRNDASVIRHHIGLGADGIRLDVIGFIVEDDERATRADEREWAVGIIAKNPFRRTPRSRRAIPDWWPSIVCDSELIVCSLRNFHPLKRPKQTYRLWSC
ncbi:MAG TPA: restriction endonuclease, partial [Acidimicrobiales bacterium]|nr:restriction endonuclease [Acidimicrobiales bacterium]